MACQDCGDTDAPTSLGGVEVCDRCFNDRISTHLGMPGLPEPPEPLVLAGPDGRLHRLRYRLLRMPTGIEVQLQELGAEIGEGYQFSVLGDHSGEVEPLIDRIRALAQAEVGRVYLEPATHHHGWELAGDEVAGRLVWDDEGDNGRPYRVVVDGRILTWEELGNALESYEGWNFRLTIESAILDARSDAEIIGFPRGDPT